MKTVLDVAGAAAIYWSGSTLKDTAEIAGVSCRVLRNNFRSQGVRLKDRGGRSLLPPRSAQDAFASQLAYRALMAGTIKKPACCSQCFGDKPLDGHHSDYNKPLDVTWLCRRCHCAWHQSNSAIHSTEIHPVDFRRWLDDGAAGGDERSSWTPEKNRYYMRARYGTLPMCPFCGKENIPIMSRDQKTCGSLGCRGKHAKARPPRPRKIKNSGRGSVAVKKHAVASGQHPAVRELALRDLDLMIKNGWGDTRQKKLPADWRVLTRAESRDRERAS